MREDLRRDSSLVHGRDPSSKDARGPIEEKGRYRLHWIRKQIKRWKHHKRQQHFGNNDAAQVSPQYWMRDKVLYAL